MPGIIVFQLCEYRIVVLRGEKMERINAINGNETVGGFWQPWTTPDSKLPVSRLQSVLTYVG